MTNELKKAIKQLKIAANKYQKMIINKHGKEIDDPELCTFSGYRKAWQNYLKAGGSTSMLNQ